MYSGHEVVRLSRAGRKIGAQFDTLNAAVYDANWKSQSLSGMMQPPMNIVGNIYCLSFADDFYFRLIFSWNMTFFESGFQKFFCIRAGVDFRKLITGAG